MTESHAIEFILKGKEEAIKLDKIPCFSYDRVSSKKQDEKGNSLDDQSDRAYAYALKNDLHIIHTFSCVESAFREGRKNFNEMLDKAIQFEIKDIIFKNTDRLGRNDYDWPRCKRLAKTQGLRVHLYELNMVYSKKSTAEEEMILDQSSALAVYWSNKISKSIMASFEHKARNGIAPFHNKMFGYIYDKHNKVYIKDPQTKDKIDYIFNTYDNSRISIHELTKHINERGYRNQLGNKWNLGTLHRMLSNPFYAGKFFHNDKIYDGTHEPYILPKKFEKRMKRMSMKFMGARKREKDFLLSNSFLLYNNLALTGEMKKGKYIYYTNRTANVTFKEEWVFQKLDEFIQKINLTEEKLLRLLSMFKGAIQIKDKGHVREKSNVTKQINILERENDKLIDKMLQGFDLVTIQKRMEDNRKRIEHLETDRQKLRIDKDDFIDETTYLFNNIRDFQLVFLAANYKQKTTLLRDMAESISVEDESVNIVWKIPFAYIMNESIMRIADALIPTTSEPVRKYTSELLRRDTFRTINDTIDKLSSYYSRAA
jgi:DNA invertase Pin-like site-specific DNA recombinase